MKLDADNILSVEFPRRQFTVTVDPVYGADRIHAAFEIIRRGIGDGVREGYDCKGVITADCTNEEHVDSGVGPKRAFLNGGSYLVEYFSDCLRDGDGTMFQVLLPWFVKKAKNHTKYQKEMGCNSGRATAEYV